MYIDWKLSPEMLKKAKRINEAKKTKTYDQLAKDTGYHRTYVIALNNYYRKLMGEK